MKPKEIQQKLAEAMPGVKVYDIADKVSFGTKAVSMAAWMNFKYYCIKSGLEPDVAKYDWESGKITDQMIVDKLGFDLERYP